MDLTWADLASVDLDSLPSIDEILAAQTAAILELKKAEKKDKKTKAFGKLSDVALAEIDRQRTLFSEKSPQAWSKYSPGRGQTLENEDGTTSVVLELKAKDKSEKTTAGFNPAGITLRLSNDKNVLLWCQLAAPILVRYGKISLDHCLILSAHCKANWKSQVQMVDALRSVLPGWRMRWTPVEYDNDPREIEIESECIIPPWPGAVIFSAHAMAIIKRAS
jgi:hypothetical protein